MFDLIRRNRDIFDSFFDNNDTFSRSSMLSTDIIENENGYVLNVELPGFNKEDIKVSIKDGYLMLEATRSQEHEENDENGKLIRKERFYGSAKRKFYVGDVDIDDVKGTFENGVLKLEVPKDSGSTKYLEL